MCVVTSQSLFDLAVWVGFEREHGFGSYLVIRHIIPIFIAWVNGVFIGQKSFDFFSDLKGDI